VEETRQHPPLSALGWAGIAAYATFTLCALGIVLGALAGVGSSAVARLVPVACVAAVVMNLLTITNALRSGVARFGRKLRYSRDDSPVAFWMAVVVSAVVALAYLCVFVVLIGIW
jgi:hypothetical protein